MEDYTFAKVDKEELERQKLSQFVCFQLNEQEFGINVNEVVEVLPKAEITPVVHTPDFIKGVINLRGEVIAIIDLKIFFSLPNNSDSDDRKIVVVHSGDKMAGFLADSIAHIQACDDVGAETIPATVTGKMAEFLTGVAMIGHRPLMILNMSNLFDSEEFRQFE